ncbi:hypothetical protein L195_g018748 [Trifolium pratense]|uniref:Uncharacterized protein n=1 Tax=Trifolium pratense TaxID=57577 RepID=A0A2K3MXM5_TRIPR|nr:hypothetical protein L195_g018748 [Trifolium pratense]
MAKNRNKKKKNGVVSMDTTDIVVSEAPQAMDTSESGAKIKVAGATNLEWYLNVVNPGRGFL